MTACGAIGALIVGGRVVGQIRCEREIGHDELAIVHETTPHGVTLEWTPEHEPDLDLFDPAERFDVEVEIPAVGPCAVSGCVLQSGHDGLHDHFALGEF